MTWRRHDVSHFDLVQLEHFDESEIELVWTMDEFDGSLNGIVRYRGAYLWFDYHSEIEYDNPKKTSNFCYVAFSLTEKEAQEALSHRDDSPRTYTGPDLVGIQPMGWFMDGKNADFYPIKCVPTKKAQLVQDGLNDAREGRLTDGPDLNDDNELAAGIDSETSEDS